jgi:hypothetical protein
MNKLLSAVLAGTAALALGGAALAAEQSGDTQSRDNQTQMQPAEPERSDAQSQRNESDSANQPSQPGDQPTQADTSDSKGSAPQQSTIKGEDQSQGQASQAIPGGGANDANSNQAGAEPNAKEQELTAALKKCDSLSGSQKQDCIDAAKKKSGEM